MRQKVAAFIFIIHNLQRDEEQEATPWREDKQNFPLPASSFLQSWFSTEASAQPSGRMN